MTVLPEQMYRMARQASDEINKGASAYFVVLGVLGTALAQMTKEGQPTPGVYENYREPGEFGEGVTVRRPVVTDVMVRAAQTALGHRILYVNVKEIRTIIQAALEARDDR